MEVNHPLNVAVDARFYRPVSEGSMITRRVCFGSAGNGPLTLLPSLQGHFVVLGRNGDALHVYRCDRVSGGARLRGGHLLCADFLPWREDHFALGSGHLTFGLFATIVTLLICGMISERGYAPSAQFTARPAPS